MALNGIPQTTCALEQQEYFDTTPAIGREFPKAQLADWIISPMADSLLRDLAITVSTRGVVFFRKQDALTAGMQKFLVHRMGELTGKPTGHGLHIHPVMNSGRELGGNDDEISAISSEQNEALYHLSSRNKKQSNKAQWHTDITFEQCPADYTSLKLTALPTTGGDTLWASGYEVYDRISPKLRSFLETLSFTAAAPAVFKQSAEKGGWELHPGPRGAPENVGTSLTAAHPVVRTHPVTGYNSIFAIGPHVKKINELSDIESQQMLDFFLRIVTDNSDLQVRHRWQNENDIAIWDNRCVYHAPTFDYAGKGRRAGIRTVGIGEKPYFDRTGRSRTECLVEAGLFE